jgi:polysaccharide pyruvyl transferase WcaK-like protein
MPELATSIRNVKSTCRVVFGSRKTNRLPRPSDYLRPQSFAGYIGWLNHGNLGDEALHTAFIELYPQLRIIGFGWQPLEMMLHHRFIQPKPVYRAVFLGGGTLINWRGYYDQFKSALDQGNTGVVFGTGVLDPSFWQQNQKAVNYPLFMREWVALLQRVEYVAVRGPQSAALLNRFGLDDVKVIGDPALSISMPRRLAADQRRGLIGFNLGCSGPIWGEQAQLNLKAVETVRELQKKGWEVEFIPMHVSDLKIASAVLQEFPGAFQIWKHFRDIPRTLARFRDYDMVIGQRLHSLVCSVAAGVPVVALEYRPKVSDFMESVGLEWFSLRTDRVTAGSLLERVEFINSNYASHQSQITGTAARYRQIQQRAAAEVGKLIEVPPGE